jgi:hypothetical protein
MANEAELLALLSTQGAELEALKKREANATIDAALAGAVSGIVRPGAPTEQVVELLRGKLTIVPDQTGKPAVVGPGYQPVGDFVRNTLAQDSWAHFRNPSPTNATAGNPSISGTPQTRQGVSFAQVQGTPDQNFGQALLAWGAANRAAAGDPRMDPSQSMGLKPRR